MAADFSQVFKEPATQAALIKTGGDLVGGALAGQAAYKRSKEEIAADNLKRARDRQFNLLDTTRAQENTDFGARQDQLDSADLNVMKAMGSSPLQFQQERMKMNTLADVLEAGGPANLAAHLGPFAPGKLKVDFRPSAAAEAPYWAQVAQLGKGGFHGANLGSIYGDGTEGGGGGEGAIADQQIGQIGRGSLEDFNQGWGEHAANLATTNAAEAEMADKDYATASEALAAKAKQGNALGKIMKLAGTGASFIPGVGQIAAPALTFAGSMINNEGLKNSALQGALSAAPFGIGKIAKGGAALGLNAAASTLGSKALGNSWGDAAAAGATGAAMGALMPRIASSLHKGPMVSPNAGLLSAVTPSPTQQALNKALAKSPVFAPKPLSRQELGVAP